MSFIQLGMANRVKVLALYISLLLGTPIAVSHAAEEIEFNTDLLDINDRENINLNQFSRAGFIMPGTYTLLLNINGHEIPEKKISFYSEKGDPNSSRACIKRNLIDLFGLKNEKLNDLTWWHDGECLDENSLTGTEVRGDLSTSTLYINIPKAYLEYVSDNWEPPSRWDNGLSGFLLDYNLNARAQRFSKEKNHRHSLTGNGTAGLNFGAWRFRADWQGTYSRDNQSQQTQNNSFEWNRLYAYRMLVTLKSKLTVGDIFLVSNMFDSFHFIGASLISDENMLPPNLRGYAPEIVGIAKTNARVVVKQQDRVIYDTLVAAGAFRIQDIDDSVSGLLDVRIEEQDGTVQEYSVNTASVPYLTRPGAFRFKMASGVPLGWKYRPNGPLFGSGEFSWGVSNGWSLYGGALISNDYQALSAGIGRDLLKFGAMSVDITHSRAIIPFSNEAFKGSSYRFSYSKTFDEYDSQVTFAGYRFSEKGFMSMNEYLDARESGNRNGNNKEMYTITMNKHFRDSGMSLFVDYSHQTYWDRPKNDRYSITLSSHFDWLDLRDLSLSLTAFRNNQYGSKDKGGYLSLSIPWGSNSTVSYSMNTSKDDTSQRISYYKRIDETSNYQISTGYSNKGINSSAYYSKEAEHVRMSANISHQEANYTAFGLGVQGGMTITPQGGALHRSSTSGNTRLLLDSNGVSDIPIKGYGNGTKTNRWGKAVIGDVNSFYKNQASIDLNKLGHNAEVTNSVVQATLTEGAIGYRKFDVISGEKAMAVITLENGHSPPFGTSVKNEYQQETGIINEDGIVYLTGIKPNEKMTVILPNASQCIITIPPKLPENIQLDKLLLTCK